MSRRREHTSPVSHVEQVQKEIRDEKRRVKRQKRRRFLKRFFLLVFLVLLVSGTVYIDKQSFSRVSAVEVDGNQYINDDIILAESKVVVGNRLIFTLAPLINRRIEKMPGIAFSEVNVYYTMGKVTLTVKEKQVVAYMREGPSVLFEDNALYTTEATMNLSFPLLVGFTEDIIKQHPEFADKLSRIESAAYYNISEIHVEPNEYETLYMRFVMNNGFTVYTSVQNMMLMNHYTEIVSSIINGDNPENRCIFFLDYYEDLPDSQVSVARPCE